MSIINKHILGKLIRKNRGNSKLVKAVQQLISDIEDSNWKTPHNLTEKRPDADCVYGGSVLLLQYQYT